MGRLMCSVWLPRYQFSLDLDPMIPIDHIFEIWFAGHEQTGAGRFGAWRDY